MGRRVASEKVIYAAMAGNHGRVHHVMTQPPWTVFIKLRNRSSGVASSSTLPACGGKQLQQVVFSNLSNKTLSPPDAWPSSTRQGSRSRSLCIAPTHAPDGGHEQENYGYGVKL